MPKAKAKALVFSFIGFLRIGVNVDTMLNDKILPVVDLDQIPLGGIRHDLINRHPWEKPHDVGRCDLAEYDQQRKRWCD